MTFSASLLKIAKFSKSPKRSNLTASNKTVVAEGVQYSAPLKMATGICAKTLRGRVQDEAVRL